MAALLVRTIDGENAQRYMKGDVVAVLPDDHVFGRMESLKVWIDEGRKAEDWPGGFAVVRLDGLTVEEARSWLEEGKDQSGAMSRRREYALAYDNLERRAPGSGRDTLRTEKQITRAWSDSDVKAAVSRKQASGK